MPLGSFRLNTLSGVFEQAPDTFILSTTSFSNTWAWIDVDSTNNIYIADPNSPGILKINDLGVIQWQKEFTVGASDVLGFRVVGSTVYAGHRYSTISATGAVPIGRTTYNASTGIVAANRAVQDAGSGGSYERFNGSLSFSSTGVAYVARQDSRQYNGEMGLFLIAANGGISGAVHLQNNNAQSYSNANNNTNWTFTTSNGQVAFLTGTVRNWVKTFSNTGGFQMSAAMDSSGNCYYYGSSGALIKLDSSGNDQWSKTFPSTTIQNGNSKQSIALDSEGNVYVTRVSTNTLVVYKLTSAGDTTWVRNLVLPAGRDISVCGIKIVNTNIYVLAKGNVVGTTEGFVIGKFPIDGTATGSYGSNFAWNVGSQTVSAGSFSTSPFTNWIENSYSVANTLNALTQANTTYTSPWTKTTS